DAVSLDRVIVEGGLLPAGALRVARQLADALEYAHERGIVHGAVRPASVFVERTDPPRALLGGFALAALPWTAAPDAAAVLSYTAPERVMDDAAAVCTDIFSL